MSDEFLFVAITFIDLAIMMLCWKAGRRWLELFIVLNYLFANLFIQKFTDIGGFTVAGGIIFYAAIFLGTDTITEHFGKRAGYQLIWKSFFAVFIMTLAQQAVLLLGTVEQSAVASEAMDTLFSAVPRITFASMVVFIFVQRFDVWFYHWIHKRTRGQFLWLRNCVSTAVSQFLDTTIFFTLAFYGTMPNDILLNMIVVGFTFKAIIALMDTPFIYMSYWIKGKKLSEAAHIPQS